MAQRTRITLPKIDRSRPLFSTGDRDNIRWFWNSYLKKRTPWLVLVLGMIIVQGAVYQQFLSLTESGLRVIFESGQKSDLISVCAMVFLLFAIRGFASYVSPRLSIWLASNAVLEMRRDLIDHIMTLDLAYFERTRGSEIILRLVNQAQDLSTFVGQATVNAVRDAATVVIISGYLIYKSPLLFTAALIFLPIIIVLMQVISGKIKEIQASAESALSNYMTSIEEMSGGMRTVKISNQEGVEKARLMQNARSIKDLAIRVQSAQALVLPTMDASSAFVYVIVIGGGGYMALTPEFGIDSAEIITFLLGMALVFDPARLLASFFTKLQANLVILDSVRSVFRENPTIRNKPGALTEFDTSADIQLRDVSFGYTPEHPLFSGLDMTIKGGKTTAIVGATGSGKTTILSLITRLYNVDDGVITIGDTPIDKIDLPTLRKAYSVVAQDIVIFNSSIWENIRYVRPEATEEEIWQAAEDAAIADFIQARGDAPLGPKGSQLSGGQKQRIAIARAFLRDAPILLLDEATSALDQKTEAHIRGSLERLKKGRTTVLVAHRLSTVVNADIIYVMEGGRIVETGTHRALMNDGGLYSNMYNAQKRDYA